MLAVDPRLTQRHAGAIDALELHSAMRTMGVNMSAEQAAQLLAAHDTSRRGSIDFADFLVMVLQQSGQVDAARMTAAHVRQMQQVFAQFDTNRSGAPAAVAANGD